MTVDKSKGPNPKRPGPATPPPGTSETLPPTAAAKPLRMFRRIDWIAFALTTLLVLVGYLYTLAPDLTLEDSGELAVGSFYAGVPHPPGYPVWTLYSWAFTKFLPISNVAYRVAVSSAVAGALACGLIALMVSRGSSMMLEGMVEFTGIERRWEELICLASGFVSGSLMAFNGFMWSQAVIVEVYTLSVLSLTGVLAALLRWLYAPHQRRYLYLAWFLFGICFNNHQSLLVIALSMEVLIAAVQPRLGRDLFFGNFLLYFAGLVGKKMGLITTLSDNIPLLVIYHGIGLSSGAACLWLIVKTKHLGNTLHYGLACFGAFMVGAAFYVYMPVASMTNPPMNWGYPRTVTGFFHAFTRGQYERIHPTTGSGDNAIAILHSFFERYVQQLYMLMRGAVEEFNPIYLLIGLIALIPFLFIRKLDEKEKNTLRWSIGSVVGMSVLTIIVVTISTLVRFKSLPPLEIFYFWLTATGLLLEGVLAFFFIRWVHQRERAWFLGLISFYIVLGPFLLVLLNPSTDRQSLSLNRVFFTASHVIIAMGIGYFLTLWMAIVCTRYEKMRRGFLLALTIFAGLALFNVAAAWQETPYVVVRATAVVGLIISLLALVILLIRRTTAPVIPLIAVIMFMPAYSVFSHWANNEQRGHLFGFWFGHDMFTPPFQDKSGQPLYPEMTKHAILFGGTDPGRFCPTYMIFAESFIPPEKRRDPKFDRRDVYIITQNALADGTYLSYIRAHYNRSAQDDPPFFSELLRSSREREDNYKTNLLARMALPLDNVFMGLGARIEKRRREEGVYPPVEIITPSNEDSQRAFSEYMADAQARMQRGALKPGEDVKVVDNRVQVSGQVAVMAINGLLTKVIFDKNPTNEFFVEESFPLDWMYPYLTPFGIIMKLNRQPLPEITEEMVQRDHSFWSQYSDRLIGNWIDYDTSVSNICDFAVKTYIRHDYSNFKGDPKFVRDDDAQKAFSKLRSSIAGLYSWRLDNARTPAEQQRMSREAEFAFKQAYAFCPYSPEALYRYVNLLIRGGRFEEARLLAVTSQKLDPDNGQLEKLVEELEKLRRQQSGLTTPNPQLTKMEAEYRANPSNFSNVMQLAAALAQNGLTNRVLELADSVVANPKADLNAIFFAVQVYSQLIQYPQLEKALIRFTAMNSTPESYMDLAGIQSILKKPDAMVTLKQALQLNRDRLTRTPTASNLALTVRADDRFAYVRSLPEYQQLMATNK